VPQRQLTPEFLADVIQKADRGVLLQKSVAAKRMQKLEATQCIVAACEELVK